MNIELVAVLIEEIYYDGRVLTGSEKLQKKDFQNMCLAAMGTIMRNLYWQMKQDGGELLYFGDNVDTKDYSVQEDPSGQRYIMIDDALLNIPFGLGIINVYPAKDSGCPERFVKQPPGADWLYCGTDFMIPFYIKKGKRLDLFGNDCVKKETKVYVDGLYFSDQLDLPQDIVWDIMNAVLGVSLKKNGWPVDPTTNDNPNITELKNKISYANGDGQ